MTLWFFSSDDPQDNTVIDAELVKSMNRAKPKLTYIASSHLGSSYYFAEFSERFARYGVKDCTLFHPDLSFTKKALQKALRSDLIYLSGGNTFYFLKHLKKSGVARELVAFHKAGGHMAGTSAGAIIMTKTIKTAGYPDFDRDDNAVGITDMRALGLVRFEFFPHYTGREIYNEELAHQSEQMAHPLYAAADGAAIAVSSEKLVFYGKITAFLRGIKFKLNN
jgi:dipeptidase E